MPVQGGFDGHGYSLFTGSRLSDESARSHQDLIDTLRGILPGCDNNQQ
jgi:hypothetical protein